MIVINGVPIETRKAVEKAIGQRFVDMGRAAALQHAISFNWEKEVPGIRDIPQEYEVELFARGYRVIRKKNGTISIGSK